MANLRDIRTRISSIRNTQQITRAMKMVAAAKLRKAQQRMLATRPYASKMGELITRLADGSQTVENPLLRQSEEIERVCLIVVGSDRGLCGGFNNNLFKTIEAAIATKYRKYQQAGTLDLIAIGRKAEAYFKKRKYQVVESYPGFFDNLSYELSSTLMNQVTDQFAEGYYDNVLIAFNEFRSVIAQNRIIETVLPIQATDVSASSSGITVQTDYIYEPDAEAILDRILPIYVNMQLWRAVLDSNAAEQGARMAAMDNATENAKELEQELQLKYNQARQSAITTEISEIVSGAAALSDN